MTLTDRLLRSIGLERVEKRSSLENPRTPLSQPALWLFEALGALGSDSGVPVSERTAIRLSAVWTCVNILAGAISSLPLKVYERQERGRRLARENRLYRILHDQPSLEDTSYGWRHKMCGNLFLWGNAYSEIIRDRANRIVALYPWPSSQVKVRPGAFRGQFDYVVTDAGGEHEVSSQDMLHLRGFCFEGLAGLSVIQNQRRSLGLSVAAELFASHFYKNGARASGVLMYPGKLNEPGKKNLQQSWDEKYSGVENSHRTIILEENTKYQQLTVPQNDAQFIETRQLSRAEIAGIFRLPTMLVPGASKDTPTYASSESFMRYFVDFSLRDWLTLWQNELNSKLFDYGDYYAEFETRDLLRADTAARAAFHKSMVEIGAKSPNEVREDENENPIPDGDRYYVPMNWVPADRVDDVLDAKTQPTPQQPSAPGAQATGNNSARAAYALWLKNELEQIRKWERFDSKRAAERLLIPISAIAHYLGQNDAVKINHCVDSLAKRAKGTALVDVEVEGAFSELSGGLNVQT